MVQQKQKKLQKKRKLASTTCFSPFCIQMLFVDFIFIQVQGNLLSAYKYGEPEVEMK